MKILIHGWLGMLVIGAGAIAPDIQEGLRGELKVEDSRPEDERAHHQNLPPKLLSFTTP